MANKTCVVNRDQAGQVSTVLVKKPEVKSVSVNAVDFAISRNNGLDLNLAPNGNPSILYQTYVDTLGMSDLEAKEQVAKVYTDSFLSKFGDWINKPETSSKVVDENGQPKIVWSGQSEAVESFKAYTKRDEATDDIDNDGFFSEDRKIAVSYATGMDAFTTPQSLIDKYGSKTASVVPVFLNIKNVQETEDINRTTITPIIEETINQNKDGFYGKFHNYPSNGWVVLDGNQVMTVESLSSEVTATETINPELNNNEQGINDIFDNNEQISSIGTKEQYSAYLDSIFPDSTMKDIVYHLTDYQFEQFAKKYKDKFGKREENLGFYFINRESVDNYRRIFGKTLKTAILNFKSTAPTEGVMGFDKPRASKEYGYEMEFLTKKNKAEFVRKGYDSGTIARDGNETEYVAFEPDQIHVLGSKVDVEGFRKYVESGGTAKNTNADYIPSQLFEQIKQLPFITLEQALDVYKNIYRPNMSKWQNGEISENVNEETGEPVLFFKADNGKIYSDLTEALKNSATGYSTGFMNDSMEFEPFLETPIYNNTTVQGKVQNLMRNEYLKASEKYPNTYEATDIMSAEFVEEDLALSMPFGFQRIGNNFIITESKAEKGFNELMKEVGLKDAV
mgnify:CR=1 FL=1